MDKVKLMALGWLKTFLTICIVLIMDKGSIWGIDWHSFANSAVMSLLPVVYNFLNPGDPRYGIGKETKIVPSNENEAQKN